MSMVGTTPKRFERMIRFRRSLHSLIDSKLPLKNIGLEAGYYDQSRFIQDFKALMFESSKDFKASLTGSCRLHQAVINYDFRLLRTSS